MQFRNPQNGHVETVSPLTWLWCLLFGGFYFAFKGIWIHFVIGLGAALLTWGLSWLIYPFFARSIVIGHFRRNGWQEVGDGDTAGTGIGARQSRQDTVPAPRTEAQLPPPEDTSATAGKVIEVYRDFEIRAVQDGFLVLGKVHDKLSDARATVDAAYE